MIPLHLELQTLRIAFAAHRLLPGAIRRGEIGLATLLAAPGALTRELALVQTVLSEPLTFELALQRAFLRGRQ